MKRISIPIVTTELCFYGCGSIAKYKNGSNNLMCNIAASKCPALRAKNSQRCRAAYNTGKKKLGSENYKDLPQDTKERMAHNKGKTADTYGPLRKGRDTRKQSLLEGKWKIP